MKPSHNLAARKRPVNLTLNEDLVTQAKKHTSNLSGVVESLLIEYVSREQHSRVERIRMIESTVAMWNKFGNDKRHLVMHIIKRII